MGVISKSVTEAIKIVPTEKKGSFGVLMTEQLKNERVFTLILRLSLGPPCCSKDDLATLIDISNI